MLICTQTDPFKQPAGSCPTNRQGSLKVMNKYIKN